MKKLLASVPYDPAKSFDFYKNSFTFNGKKIRYESVNGYCFSYQNTSYSVSLVPAANSTVLRIHFLIGKKTISFTRSANSAMLFKGEKHDTLQLIFSELIKCIEAFIAPYVFEQICEQLDSGHDYKIGALTITNDSIMKKTVFGKKEMEEFGYTSIDHGYVRIHYPDGKSFDAVSLSVMNAPLIPYILNKYFKEDA